MAFTYMGKRRKSKRKKGYVLPRRSAKAWQRTVDERGSDVSPRSRPK